MKKRRIVKLILMAIALALIVIQFIPVDRSVPASDAKSDFLAGIEGSESAKALVKNACYDCHSYDSKYPWYAYVAPVSLWLQDHINEGREHLNFSEWANYTVEKRDHKLEEMVEMVHEGEMPLNSYLIAHPEARLTDAERQELTGWFEGMR